MSNDDDIDWDAFAILSADPEIDTATAYVASIRDEPPGPEQQLTNGQAGLVIVVIIVGVAICLFLMAL